MTFNNLFELFNTIFHLFRIRILQGIKFIILQNILSYSIQVQLENFIVLRALIVSFINDCKSIVFKLND